MAASMITGSSITSTDSSTDELVHCGICHKLLQDPKTLSCLHSFCLKCLQQQLDEKETTSLPCPTCSTETKLPSGDVVDLGVIAFVSRKRNEALIQENLADKDATIMCTNCEGSDDQSPSGRTTVTTAEAVTLCFECDDYLCQSCTKMHKIFKLLKHHSLFTLDPIRKSDPIVTRPEHLSEDKGEILMFYCETCDVPICSKCVVIAHRHPEHKQAELDSAAAERSKEIQELERESAQVASKIDELIASNEVLVQKLKTASSVANTELYKTMKSVKKQMLNILEEVYSESKDNLEQYEERKLTSLRNKLIELKGSRARLQVTRMLAKDITQEGSEFEVAAVYANITSSLRELNVWKLQTTAPKLGKVQFRKFRPNLPVISTLVELGSPPLKMNKVKEFGELRRGRGIICTKVGTYIVANSVISDCYVFSAEGSRIKLIDTGYYKTGGGAFSYPWCVVMHPNGRIFGTGKTYHVKQYQEDGKYVNRYITQSPDNIDSDEDDSTIQGLALDTDGNLIAGNVTKKYISIMKPDGTHITSMYVPIKPYFIGTTPTDNIIISSYEERAVHVIDRTGQVLITFDPPDGVSVESWNPTGICCSMEGDVFVANYQGEVGIYQYRYDNSRCVACNTTVVTEPWGLALSTDEETLAVADNTCIKIFKIAEY
ncbi:LOW QUALITY PROTEIN: uncharacterized protein [Amphiura filiformis]|uniref:LOW QUALITY PROTEIN: uncharacterized protein n=1 Tax=Amphiura filiformis TaxID=82378 RepID=UPI003B219532